MCECVCIAFEWVFECVNVRVCVCALCMSGFVSV